MTGTIFIISICHQSVAIVVNNLRSTYYRLVSFVAFDGKWWYFAISWIFIKSWRHYDVIITVILFQIIWGFTRFRLVDFRTGLIIAAWNAHVIIWPTWLMRLCWLWIFIYFVQARDPWTKSGFENLGPIRIGRSIDSWFKHVRPLGAVNKHSWFSLFGKIASSSIVLTSSVSESVCSEDIVSFTKNLLK